MRMLLFVLAMLPLVGCGKPKAKFALNEISIRLSEKEVGEQLTAENVENISTALTALFGTPDKPYLLGGEQEAVAEVLNLDLLRLAAGPVETDDQGIPHGLYRVHCAHCHGVTGDGAGPTAIFLNPYPRDYRAGKFKFKSTALGVRPTHDDLMAILREGIPGTAMPSFKLLADDDLEVMVHYVKYLAIRGEVEELMIREIGDNGFLDLSPNHLMGLLNSVCKKWASAASSVQKVEQPSAQFDHENKVAIGRELFFGAGACIKCHGDTQLGDGVMTDFDDWTKNWATSEESIDEFRKLGALPPRNIIPRNLRLGVFRGGRRPVDIYNRIRHGIDGTPMPGQPLMSADDVWYLVYYVLNLQHEPLSGGKTVTTEHN